MCNSNCLCGNLTTCRCLVGGEGGVDCKLLDSIFMGASRKFLKDWPDGGDADSIKTLKHFSIAAV